MVVLTGGGGSKEMRIGLGNPAADVARAAGSLLSGNILLGPTDTVYGLFADAGNEAALFRVFKIKGRPLDKPLPLLVAGIDEAHRIALLSKKAVALAQAFWPGPLTLVVPAQGALSKLLVRNGKIAVRCPDSEFCRSLAEAMGGFVAATSANPSGVPATADPERIEPVLRGSIDVFVDGGDHGSGLASTLVEIVGDEALVLREGAIKAEDMRNVLGLI